MATTSVVKDDDKLLDQSNAKMNKSNVQRSTQIMSHLAQAKCLFSRCQQNVKTSRTEDTRAEWLRQKLSKRYEWAPWPCQWWTLPRTLYGSKELG